MPEAGSGSPFRWSSRKLEPRKSSGSVTFHQGPSMTSAGRLAALEIAAEGSLHQVVGVADGREGVDTVRRGAQTRPPRPDSVPGDDAAKAEGQEVHALIAGPAQLHHRVPDHR